jgi:hypothetical protein
METTTQQKPPLSRYVGTLLFLSIVYAPLVPAWLWMGDVDWMGMYASQAYAWVIILSGFGLLIIINACRLFRFSRVFAILSVVLLLIPLKLALVDAVHTGIGASSELDTNPVRGMIDFWTDGGGFFMGVLTLPLAIWYVVLLVRERNGRRSPATNAVTA